MQDIPQMTIVTWIIVGAIAGFLASVISGSREGLLMMVVLNPTSIIVAVAGALIVLFVVNSLSGRRRAFGR